MKEKFTVSVLTNNYGEDRQNAIWRGGVSINIARNSVYHLTGTGCRNRQA